MSAFKYDHDAEARRGTLRIYGDRLDEPTTMDHDSEPGSIHHKIALSDDEAIELYRLLAATWAGYVAEMDDAERAVRAGVPLATFLDGWKADTIGQYTDDLPDESFGAYVDSGAADQMRDSERGK